MEPELMLLATIFDAFNKLSIIGISMLHLHHHHHHHTDRLLSLTMPSQDTTVPSVMLQLLLSNVVTSCPIGDTW